MEQDWKSELKQIVDTHREAKVKFNQNLLEAVIEAEAFHNTIIAATFRAVRDEWVHMGHNYNATIRLSNEVRGESSVIFKENNKTLLSFGVKLHPLSTGTQLEPLVNEYIKGTAVRRSIPLTSYLARDWTQQKLIALILSEIRTTLSRELMDYS